MPTCVCMIVVFIVFLFLNPKNLYMCAIITSSTTIHVYASSAARKVEFLKFQCQLLGFDFQMGPEMGTFMALACLNHNNKAFSKSS